MTASSWAAGPGASAEELVLWPPWENPPSLGAETGWSRVHSGPRVPPSAGRL